MNAQQLLEIIQKGNSLDKEDFRALIKLHETFPYFLVPKVLAAKYEYNISKGESKELLHWAAVQSPNRAWLKKMILNDLDFIKGNPSPLIAPPEDDNPHDSNKGDHTTANEDQGSENVSTPPREKVLKQLEENLSKLKKKEDPSTSSEGDEPQKARKKSAAEDLIETIKKKEKKIIKDVRKQEQSDIIQAFNDKNIKLAAIRESEEPKQSQDLSRQSTQLNENLLSESYAKLLIKQGKKEKAIKIYEKLILKFPKKKAYFADLINELKD